MGACAGLLAVAFGPAYTYVVLRIVYGRRWSETDAPQALGVYCAYILLLAVNGILEAFVHAVARSRQVAPPLPVCGLPAELFVPSFSSQGTSCFLSIPSHPHLHTAISSRDGCRVTTDIWPSLDGNDVNGDIKSWITSDAQMKLPVVAGLLACALMEYL